MVGCSKRLHQSQHPSGSGWGWICKKDNGGERRILVLTIGDGEPSILLLDFDFVPLVLALCVHRLVCFLLRGLHNLSLRLPLLGRGRAHISAECSRHGGLPSTGCVLAQRIICWQTRQRACRGIRQASLCDGGCHCPAIRILALQPRSKRRSDGVACQFLSLQRLVSRCPA